MTAYEIADIRAAIGMRLATQQTAYFTLTLALFAAAYATAGKLDTFAIVGLIMFAIFNSVTYGRLTNLAFFQMDALQRDAEKLADRTGERAEILGEGMITIPRPARIGVLLMYVTITVAFAFYVLNQAGLFG